MKKVQSLIDKYEACYQKDDVFPEIEVFPTKGNPVLTMRLTGMFSQEDLDQSTITDFVITRLLFDNIKIEQIDEDFFFDLARAVMAGQYRYVIRKESLMEKIYTP